MLSFITLTEHFSVIPAKARIQANSEPTQSGFPRPRE
jgi:hypothetical protein